MPARPVLAAEPWRSMSSDDGVECGSASASVRRARSRRGTFPADTAEAFFLTAVFGCGAAAFAFGRLTGFFLEAAFGAAFLLAFLAGALFLADALRFAGRAAAFRPVLVGLARIAALRFAITQSFRNLDSLTISVVLSVAY